MNKLKILLFGLLSVGIIVSFKTIDDWFLFENRNYKLQFPKAPITDSSAVESQIGKLTIFTHMYESPENTGDSNLVYGLIETEYPAKYFESKEPVFSEKFFRGAIDGAAKKVDGKLISEKVITVNSYPGREISVDYGDGAAIVTMQMILVKTRFLSLQTISYTGKEKNGNARRFFNSLTIK